MNRVQLVANQDREGNHRDQPDGKVDDSFGGHANDEMSQARQDHATNRCGSGRGLHVALGDHQQRVAAAHLVVKGANRAGSHRDFRQLLFN